MTKNCFNNPIIRDGTSQQMRLIKSLLPDYVSVDERGFDELKQFVLEFAKELQYYNQNGNRSGDWFDFFNQKLKSDKRTEPHYALFQAFLELFSIAQADLNTLTKRHLDFYYKDVLRLKEKSPVADQVFVIFQLAKHIAESGHLIEKGTRLKAGSDALGNNVFYTTTQDIVINKALVAGVKGLFKNSETSRMYSSPIANSSDGLGTEIESDTQSWIPFGNEQRTDANIGFAIASPILNLREGTRTVKLLLEFREITKSQMDVIKTLSEKQLNDMFDVYFSGEEEWISPSPAELVPEDEMESTVENRIIDFLNRAEKWQDIAGIEPQSGPVYDSPYSGYGDQYKDYDIGKKGAQNILDHRETLSNKQFSNLAQVRAVPYIGEDKINDLKYSFRDNYKETTFNFSNNFLCITRTISRDQEAIVGYNEKELADPIKTKLPVVKVLLNTNPDLPYIYDTLIDLQLKEAKVTVEVSEVKNLVVQNDQTVMDPAKTIQPFGIIPVLGSNFYVGNQEVFQKKLNYLKVNINWYGLPTDPVENTYLVTPADNGNAPVYAKQTLYGFDGHYAEYLKPRTNTSFKTRVSILDKKSWVELKQGLNLFSDTDNVDLIPERSLEFGSDTVIKTIERDVDLEPFRNLDTDSKKGFIRFELIGKDFGHKDYTPSYTNKVLQGLQLLEALNNPNIDLPKEPYTPVIESISLDYHSQVSIKFNSDNEIETGTGEDSVEQFFQMAPFGAAEIGCKASENSYFLPQFRNEGELYIGIEQLAPPQNISLLIQILEGSESPLIEKPDAVWEYLSDNKWEKFRQSDILSDTTNGLVKSGLVHLAIPKEASSDNTVLTSGLHWLKVSVANNSGAIPDFIRVISQAVMAEFENNNNDPDYLSQALAAETISKLEFSDSSVKKLTQPFTSFGGKVKEQSRAFYKRISERLRHKQRAITIWDYEHLILEEFPSVYKVKCLNHTKYTGDKNTYSDIAPGNVSLIVIPNVLNRNAVAPLEPQTSISTFEDIKTFLNKYRGLAFDLHIQNPIYEKIRVDFKVKFRTGFDIGFYKRKLEDEIKGFLAPWAYSDSPEIVFGTKIHQSMILNFIDERPYVDFVSCFKLFNTAASSEAVEVAVATTSASVLTSVGQVNRYGDHLIEVIEGDVNCSKICDDNQIDPPPAILSVDSCCDDDNNPDADKDDLYDYSQPDPNLCPEPEQVDDCAELPDSEYDDEGEMVYFIVPENDPIAFENISGKLTISKVNATYIIPKSSNITIGIKVAEVIDSRNVLLVGDWSTGTYNRIESVTHIGSTYNIRGGKQKPVFDGKFTSISISDKDHELVKGEWINLFKTPLDQFQNLYLPKVTEEMAEKSASISIQVIGSRGSNVQIRRNEEAGLDRLQKFENSKTDEANIALNNSDISKICSIRLIAKRFGILDGYNELGWQVTEENKNSLEAYIGNTPDSFPKEIAVNKKKD